MNKQIDAVKEFHTIYKLGHEDNPCLVSQDVGQLRYNLMAEENEEYLEAVKNGDIIEIADALGDQMYILCGTILKHGMQNIIEKVFNEIHRSNLSKLDENGQPIYRADGKVSKGPNYSPPNLVPILYTNDDDR